MFANSQMMGIDMGFPDVCLTPVPPAPAPVPIPYPNIALGPMGVPAAYHCLIMAMPAHNMLTTIPLSNGDNPGIATGVASGVVMGPSRRLTASFTVLMGGAPATKLTSMGIQNNTNCPGMRIVPSQVKIVMLAP
jgi:hypothetical protein